MDNNDNKNKMYNCLNVTYTKYSKGLTLYRSINNTKISNERYNPCVRAIFLSVKEVACSYAELHGKSGEKKLHKYTLIQDTNVVNINWNNISLILKFLKNTDTLSLRNSVTITSRDAINIVKIYFTYKTKNKALMINPTEVYTVNSIKYQVCDWFSNIMAYLGFSGYLIDYGFNYLNSKQALYPPEINFIFPRIQLKYNLKPVKCNKNDTTLGPKFEPYYKIIS